MLKIYLFQKMDNKLNLFLIHLIRQIYSCLLCLIVVKEVIFIFCKFYEIIINAIKNDQYLIFINCIIHKLFNDYNYLVNI